MDLYPTLPVQNSIIDYGLEALQMKFNEKNVIIVALSFFSKAVMHRIENSAYI